MTAPRLGRLAKVDLRTAWSHEATEFTPWLAAEDNIRLLGETLGLELEVLEQEAQVGPFRADILCRNTADNTLVLVENQLERTDHGHLGQLFTYAAGLDAVTVIWIASRFTDEHQAALDWLNRITHDDFCFFGLEIELWRVGNSEPAPKFNIVAKPNDWSRGVAEARRGGGTRTSGQQRQVDFWAQFGEVIRDTNRTWKVPKPQASGWVGYGIGRSGFELLPAVAVNRDRVAVRLAVVGADADAHFHLLLAEREAIERELGFEPDWQVRPNRKSSVIAMRREGDLSTASARRPLIVWMLDVMDAFDRVLRPRISLLDAADWSPDVDEGNGS